MPTGADTLTITAQQRSALRTLVYFDLFHHPLRPEEVVRFADSSMSDDGILGDLVEQQLVRSIDGYLLMGSTNDDGFFKSDAFKRRVPVYLGHGTGDIVISWKSQEAFFKKIKQLDPSYPAKFALFDTGSHGTPIRMTDWRLILNWMLQVDGA